MSDAVSAAVARRVRAAARDRCGYCLSPQKLVMARLEIEHVVPRSKGGGNDESNLWLSCPLCNRFKSDHTEWIDAVTGLSVPLFNPRMQDWFEHFQWTTDGLRIIGKTPMGRATASLLRLADDPDAILVRSFWVEAGWHPPVE